VVNYADIADLTLLPVLLNNRDPVPGFTPATPGCARKVDVVPDPNRRVNRVKVRATGTVQGRMRRERDIIKFIR
jgi:hypothetical protein